MASKSRKKIFPKPPQRLNSTTALTLGKNSHKFRAEYLVGLHYQKPKEIVKPKLTELQEAMLARIKRNKQ